MQKMRAISYGQQSTYWNCRETWKDGTILRMKIEELLNVKEEKGCWSWRWCGCGGVAVWGLFLKEKMLERKRREGGVQGWRTLGWERWGSRRPQFSKTSHQLACQHQPHLIIHFNSLNPTFSLPTQFMQPPKFHQYLSHTPPSLFSLSLKYSLDLLTWSPPPILISF